LFYTNALAFDTVEKKLIECGILVLIRNFLLFVQKVTSSENKVVYTLKFKYQIFDFSDKIIPKILSLNESFNENEDNLFDRHNASIKYAFKLENDGNLERFMLLFYDFESYSFFQKLLVLLNQYIDRKLPQYLPSQCDNELNKHLNSTEFKNLIDKRKNQINKGFFSNQNVLECTQSSNMIVSFEDYLSDCMIKENVRSSLVLNLNEIIEMEEEEKKDNVEITINNVPEKKHLNYFRNLFSNNRANYQNILIRCLGILTLIMTFLFVFYIIYYFIY
jgi:hypothetical protein